MAKNRSGPGGGGISPTPATPSVVQFAGAYATGTTVSVTLTSTPTPGNALVAILGMFNELVIPNTTGFSWLFQALEATGFGGNWVLIGGLTRTVQAGDGTAWTFNVGDGTHIGAVGLYEVTPFILGGIATQGTNTGSGAFESAQTYPLATALGLGAGIAFPALTTPVTFNSINSQPNFGWPVSPDLELYDPTGAQYGAMTVTANIAGHPILATQAAQVYFNYTEVNAQNAYNLAVMLLLVA